MDQLPSSSSISKPIEVSEQVVRKLWVEQARILLKMTRDTMVQIGRDVLTPSLEKIRNAMLERGLPNQEILQILDAWHSANPILSMEIIRSAINTVIPGASTPEGNDELITYIIEPILRAHRAPVAEVPDEDFSI